MNKHDDKGTKRITEANWQAELDRVLKPMEGSQPIRWSAREVEVIDQCLRRKITFSNAQKALAALGYKRSVHGVSQQMLRRRQAAGMGVA